MNLYALDGSTLDLVVYALAEVTSLTLTIFCPDMTTQEVPPVYLSSQPPPSVTFIITTTTICHYHHHNHHHLSILSSSQQPLSVNFIITTTAICQFCHHNHHHQSLLSLQPPPPVTSIITTTTISHFNHHNHHHQSHVHGNRHGIDANYGPAPFSDDNEKSPPTFAPMKPWKLSDRGLSVKPPTHQVREEENELFLSELSG